MEVAAALHHTARQRTRLTDEATQTTGTRDRSTAHVTSAAAQTETFAAPALVDPDVAATCAATADITQFLEPPIPDKFVALVPADTYTALSHMTEYVTSAPVDFYTVVDCAVLASTGTYATPAPVVEHAAPAHTVTCTAPSPVTEDVAPAPSSSCAAPASVNVRGTCNTSDREHVCGARTCD